MYERIWAGQINCYRCAITYSRYIVKQLLKYFTYSRRQQTGGRGGGAGRFKLMHAFEALLEITICISLTPRTPGTFLGTKKADVINS